MKKSIILFIAILFIANLSYSQLYVGAKLGIAPSTLSFKDLPNHKSGLQAGNILAGVVFEYPIVLGFSIQPEIQFVQRGVNLKAIRENTKDKKPNIVINEGNYYSDYSLGTNTDPAFNDNGIADWPERFKLPNLYENIKLRMNYIEGQLLFKYELLGGGLGWYFELGPYYSIGIKSKGVSTLIDKDKKKNSDENLIASTGDLVENYTDLIKTYPTNLNLDFQPFIKDDVSPRYHFKKNDFGAVVGAGLYKDLDFGRLYFDFRVLWGLANLNNDKIKNSSTVKSRSGQLSLTYLFPLGG